MVSDREPRYRLVDADGNVVGSLYAESDGTLKLQEGTSGSDNEVSVATDGTFTAPAVSTDKRTVTDLSGLAELNSSNQTISNSTNTVVDLDTNFIEDADAVNVDLSNNKLVAQYSGQYIVSGAVAYASSADWSAGDKVEAFIQAGGVQKTDCILGHHGNAQRMSVPLPSVPIQVDNPPLDIQLLTRQEAGQGEELESSGRRVLLTATYIG